MLKDKSKTKVKKSIAIKTRILTQWHQNGNLKVVMMHI
jgi:hypothetical protein